MKKKDDSFLARLDKRFYAILTALLLIGFFGSLTVQ